MSSGSAPSQSNRIKCKYCEEEVVVKNYPRHLKKNHKDSDQSDRSGKGSQLITSFFKKRSHEDDGYDANTEATFNVQRKRHCSGDSAP